MTEDSTKRRKSAGRQRPSSRRSAALAVALLAIVGSMMGAALPAGAAPTSASEVDPTGGAACTNFYPELCMDESGGIDFGLFDSTDGYLAAVSALARHRAGDDTDGNSIPDSVEIAVCGAAGCLPAWAENSTPTEPKVLKVECCDGTFEPSVNSVLVTLPPGFNKKKLISAFSLSTVNVHYFGAYPASGTVTFSVDPPDLSVGVHRFIVVGTAEGKAEPKVAIWKVEVSPESTAAVKSVTKVASNAGSSSMRSVASSSSRPVVRTGSSVTGLVWFAAALLMVGCGVIAVDRRRSDRRYY